MLVLDVIIMLKMPMAVIVIVMMMMIVMMMVIVMMVIIVITIDKILMMGTISMMVLILTWNFGFHDIALQQKNKLTVDGQFLCPIPIES